MSEPFVLPDIPKAKEYEEYIAAYLQAGGLYVERNAIYRGEGELLELDILTTQITQSSITKNLVEIKSGDWGFAEIFKVRGWLDYLGLEAGSFIVQESRERFDFYRGCAKEINIDLIDNSNLENTKNDLRDYLGRDPGQHEVQAIRTAFYVERKLMEKLKTFKKLKSEYVGYKALDDFYYIVNSKSLFYCSDAISRIKSLFHAYRSNRNITAKLSNELAGRSFDDEFTKMWTPIFGIRSGLASSMNSKSRR